MSKLYPKKCRYCGKEYNGESAQKYCSRLCANRGRRTIERNQYDHSLIWERSAGDKTRWQCPYNENVSCNVRECNKCGWHPEVAKARSEEIKRKFMAVEEEC